MIKSIIIRLILISNICSCLPYTETSFLQELSDIEIDSGFIIIEDARQELDPANLYEVERPSSFFIELMMQEDNDEITSNTDDQLLDEIFYGEQEDLDADEIFDTESDEAKELEDSFSGELWEA